ncbi:MAG: ExbD/TolR family protein [Planctomycetota bacterium]
MSIPLIDLAFLSLGAVVAILSQSHLVRSLPVEVTEVGRGIAVISREAVTVITITTDGLYADGRPVALSELADAVNGRLVLLRVDRRVPTETLVGVMSVLAANDVELRIEVEERPEGVS